MVKSYGLSLLYPSWAWIQKNWLALAMPLTKKGNILIGTSRLCRGLDKCAPPKPPPSAESIGLDFEALRTHIRESDYDTRIRNNIRLAQRLGIRGTPGFIVFNRQAQKTEKGEFPAPASTRTNATKKNFLLSSSKCANAPRSAAMV